TPALVTERKPWITRRLSGSGSSSPIHASNRSPRMYSASARRPSRSRKSRNCVLMSGRVPSRCRSEMKSVVTSVAGVTRSLQFHDPDDDHRLHRRVLFERSDFAGSDRADIVDDLHALGDPTEHCIAPPARLRIERQVVGDVEIELRVAAVRVARAREPDGAAAIRQAIAGLVGNAGPGRLLLVLLVEATALGDEAGDHAMEDRALVEPGAHVLEKV